jgi:hypothetical protein
MALARALQGAQRRTDRLRWSSDDGDAEQVVAAFGFVDVDLHRDSLAGRGRVVMERLERVRGTVVRR